MAWYLIRRGENFTPLCLNETEASTTGVSCRPFEVQYYACRQDGLLISAAHHTTEELGLRVRLVYTQNFSPKIVLRDFRAYSLSYLIGTRVLSLGGKMR
jgi:hypothetical protein